jgi:hypothetical protein
MPFAMETIIVKTQVLEQLVLMIMELQSAKMAGVLEMQNDVTPAFAVHRGNLVAIV